MAYATKKSAYGTAHQTFNRKAYSDHQTHTGCTKGHFRAAFSQMHIQDAAGNAARTTPYYLDPARSGHIPKKLLGGLLAMAAIGSLIASPDLAQKLGIGGLFGVPAMSLLMEDTDRTDVLFIIPEKSFRLPS